MELEERLVRHLIETVRCSNPDCWHAYGLSDYNVFGHQDELWFIQVRCPSCGLQGLIAAVVKEGTAESSSSPPDQIQEKGVPLSEADVEEMHDFLEGFGGDFKQILGDS